MVQDFIGNKLVGGNNHFIMVKKMFAYFFKFSIVFMLELSVEWCWMLVIIEVHYESGPHFHED
jgi:hypothetical protein